MPVNYVDTAVAKEASGIRVSFVSNVPSPWGEAVKAILHVKGLDYLAFRLDTQDTEQIAWTGHESAPVLLNDDDAALSGWVDILLFAEQKAPTPPLLPSDPEQRAFALGLSHELIGAQGLAWARRAQQIHGGLTGGSGFSPGVSAYLAAKYGYTPQIGAAAEGRVVALLTMLSNRLKHQAELGHAYLLGSAMTCVDIYAATTCALFAPLPEADCAMRASTRAIFEDVSPAIATALDPVLLAHRDRMYRDHLELPLAL